MLGCGHSQSPDPQTSEQGDQAAKPHPSVSAQGSPTEEGGLELKKLFVDIGTSQACEALEGKFMAMTAETGTSFEGGKDATVGTLWIEKCRTEEETPEVLKLAVEGRGWKWIERTSEAVGADFTVAQYLRFGVDASMSGTVDAHYASEDHIVTAWLVPKGKVETKMTPLQDVSVNEEGLWSEIVGAAATLVKTDPDVKADRKVKKQGNQNLRDKLTGGFSGAIDLCTGRRYMKAGSLPPGKLPTPAVEYADQRAYLVNSDGVLHPDGLILAGPFDPKRPVIAEVIVPREGAPVVASFVCKEEGTQLAEAYVEQKELPPVADIAVEVVAPGATKKLTAPANECEPVLVLRPQEKKETSMKYSTYYEGKKIEPLVDCSGVDPKHRESKEAESKSAQKQQ